MKKFKSKPKTIIFAVVFLLFILIFFSFTYSNWREKYYNKVLSGTVIGNLDLSYLSPEEAEKKVIRKIDDLEVKGIPVSYNNKTIYLPSVLTINTDISFPIFFYNHSEIITSLEEKYISKNFFSYLVSKVTKPFNKSTIEISYFLDQEKAKSFIKENLKDAETLPINASFIVKDNANDLAFEIEHERIGRKINFEPVWSSIESYLENFEGEVIELRTITDRPTVYAADLEKLKTAAQELVRVGDLELKTNDNKKKWLVKKEIVASWIIAEKVNDNYQVNFDIPKISSYLEENIAKEINQEAKTPKYEMENGKIISWQLGADGQELDSEASAFNIRDNYLIKKEPSAELVIKITKNELNDNPDELKIKEIIGTGHSNFVGSPSNRIHNIKIGAAAVNGMLIAPGEEFSLVKTLGEIDAAAGYLPELVIKNNRTIPEYGGGLCQVATTIFRSALDSGLNITARQNHSYRVSYYEPAGTDAAVYDPWPDVKFVNDTGNYILIQSRIDKNDIWFDFWGQGDGREATSTAPVVYNIVKPAPTKIIESPDLKPGEKKCTEKAHNGADAYFDYIITYTNGEKTTRRFNSHYVPWQEVCLVGIDNSQKEASSTPETTGSSTPEIN